MNCKNKEEKTVSFLKNTNSKIRKKKGFILSQMPKVEEKLCYIFEKVKKMRLLKIKKKKHQ